MNGESARAFQIYENDFLSFHGFNLVPPDQDDSFACYSFVPISAIPIKVIMLDNTQREDDGSASVHERGFLDEARGLAFGESRNVCNAHGHSDVVQGRAIAAGAVSRLHSDPAFPADLESARVELAAVRKRGHNPHATAMRKPRDWP
jgi:hypothetical protein